MGCVAAVAGKELKVGLIVKPFFSCRNLSEYKWVIHSSTPCLICCWNNPHGGASANQHAEWLLEDMWFSVLTWSMAKKPFLYMPVVKKKVLASLKLLLICLQLEMHGKHRCYEEGKLNSQMIPQLISRFGVFSPVFKAFLTTDRYHEKWKGLQSPPWATWPWQNHETSQCALKVLLVFIPVNSKLAGV